jgi:hypothetical protein
MIFKELTEAEEKTFREYAKTHNPENDDWEIYHPVCREVWTERGLKPKPPQKT